MECATTPPSGARDDLPAVAFDVESLMARLAALTDPRKRRGIRYSLAVILILIVLAKLAGEDRPSAIGDWVRHRTDVLRGALHLRRARLPHQNTFRRILTEVVSPAELETTVATFLRDLPRSGQSVLIAIDGKTVRGTIGEEHPRGEHLLAAYLPEEGLVLLQVATGTKENEISVAPTLLQAVDLRGKIVMGDAMHTQRALSVQILEAGGDYLWIAKDNQPTLRQDIATLFAPPEPSTLGGHEPTDFRTARTVSKGHGRCDTRAITVSSDLAGYLDWPGAQQVFQIRRERRELKTGKTTHETVQGLTSLAGSDAGPDDLLALVRAYWGIENGLHRRRDVTFREDATRMTRGNGGRVMAILNNLIIGLLRWSGYTNLAQARRFYDGHLPAAVALVTRTPS